MNRQRSVDIYQIDAFATHAFGGNPAAVCVFSSSDSAIEKPAWPYSSSVLAAIAAEMNLSETAFILPTSSTSVYHLRWFTPTTEVPLCGHGTLSAAAVLFYHHRKSREILEGVDSISFETLSGTLTCFRGKRTGHIEMNFPSNEPRLWTGCENVPKAIVRALGVRANPIAVTFSERTGKLLLRFRMSRDELMSLTPDTDAMLRIDQESIRGVIVTVAGSNTGEFDFHSRYFAPWVGIQEDPVTGSAHTVLAPFWGRALSKKMMLAEQCSKRGGALKLAVESDGVRISGDSVLVLRGVLLLDRHAASL